MSTQHTAGPWKVIEVDQLSFGGDHVADMSNGLMVVPLLGQRLGDPLADARLIAAAPELLGDLRGLLDLWHGGHIQVRPEASGAWHAAVQAGENTIANAMGNAP